MSSPPRRIAFLLTQDRGGPTDVAVELVAALSGTHSWEVRLFGPRPMRGAERVQHCHHEVVVPSKGAVGAIRATRTQLLAWRPDLVHAQDRRSGLIAAGLSWGPRRSGRPQAVVHTYHGVPDDVTEDWFRDGRGAGPSAYTRAVLAADAVVARSVTRTVVPATAMGRFLTDRLHVPERRWTHIDNGLTLPPPSVPAWPVRKLLFVGLLVRRKGVHLLLDALASADLPPGVTVTIAGDGPERASLEKQRDELGLAELVTFLGYRSDVPTLLADADAFILPSEMEQQPLVLIEAMGAGKPVVATDVGGVAEMVGDAGLVVPPGQVDALAAALTTLTTRPPHPPGDWGERAAARARARFSAETLRDEHVALYEALLSRRQEAP